MSVTKSSPVSWDLPPLFVSFRELGSTPGFTQVQIASGVNFSSFDFVTHGGSVPDYKRRIATNQSATSSLEAEKLTSNIRGDEQFFTTLSKKPPYPSGDTLEQRMWGNLSMFDDWVTPGTVPLDWVEDATTIAMERFVSKALEAQQAVSTLVCLGEFAEVARMIRNPLQSLYRGCFDYLGSVKKRTRRKSRRKAKKIITDTWLEYSFGWMPLINDVRGACDAAARLSTYSPPGQFVSGAHTFEANTPRYSEIATGGFTWEKHGSHQQACSVRLYGNVRVASAPTHTTDVLGLSLRDVVPSLWNLIPYSFLVDYFTNVGAILNSLSVRSCDLNWVNRGIRTRSAYVCHPASNVKAPGSSTWLANQPVQSTCRELVVTRTKVKREAWTGGLIPPLRVKIPNTATKWLNIGALILANDRTSREVSSNLL